MLDIETLRQATRRFAPLDLTPGWLKETRDQALQALETHGLPTTADEEWRYTDLAPLAARITEISRLQGPPERIELPDGDFLDDAAIVVIDGIFRPDLVTQPLPPGVTVRSMITAPALPSDLPPDGGYRAAAGGIESLKTTLLRDILLLEIAPGIEVTRPIRTAFFTTGRSLCHDVLMVRIGPGSRATVIEHHGGTGAGVSSTSMRIDCGPGSRLHYAKVEELPDAACHLGSQQIQIGEDASAALLHVDIGGHLVRNDLQVNLLGRAAEVTANGLFFADDSRHIDIHTRIDHLKPHTRSRELYRGIADGKGRGVFNGKVIVHRNAYGSDAQLRNQNLLLGSGSEIDTKPELEIYTDDVKCAHGATTGQLDPNAVFYLRTRGIPAELARQLLVASFAREIVMELPEGYLLDHVIKALAPRLPALREAGECP